MSSEKGLKSENSDVKLASLPKKQFSAIVKNAPVTIWIDDYKQNRIYVNKTCLDFVGKSFKSQLGKGWLNSVYSNDRKQTWDDFEKAFKSRKKFQVEYRVKRFDGKLRWVLDSGVPQFSSKEVFMGYIGSRIDITARKTMEEKLSTSEIRFRTLMEQSPLSIQIYSKDGYLVNANKAWENMWGVKFSTLEKIRYNILKDKQLEGKGIMHLIKQAFNGETVTIPPLMYEPNVTIKGVTKVTLKWVQSWMYPIRNAKGELSQVCLIHQDMTGQKLAEDRTALHASISQSLSDAVIATDNDFRITSWNKGAEELYKMKATDVIGMQFGEAVPTNFLQDSKINWQRTMNKTGYWNGEVIQESKDGEKLYILSSTSVVKNSQGQIIGNVAINRDITARKNFETLLKESEFKFKSLLSANILGIFQAKLSGEVVESNKTFLSMLGYTRGLDSVGSLSWLKVIAFKHKTDLDTLIQQISKTKTAGPIVCELIRKDKSNLPVLLGMSLLDKEKGTVIAFCIDMSKQQKAEDDLKNAKGQLEIILKSIADGITVQDADGKIVFANDTAAKSIGFSSAKELMESDTKSINKAISRLKLFDEQGNELLLSDLPGKKALKGAKESELIIQSYDTTNDTSRWSLVRSRPIYGEKGKVTHAVNIITDMTDRMQLELSLRFLVEASEILSSSLDYRQTFRSIAELAVPNIADWCVVDMIEDNSVKAVAIVHKDPSKIKQATEYRDLHPIDLSLDYGTAKVIRTGKPEFYPYISPELLKKYIKGKKEMELVKQIGFTSSLIVPLKIRNKVYGVITFVTAESKRRLTDIDLYMAEQLASRASSALENAMLYNDVNNERRRINDLVANVPGIVWETWENPDITKQRIDFVSSYIEKMLGYTVDDWLNTPKFWLSIIHPDDREKAMKEAEDIFKNCETGVSRYRWITKEGKIIWVESQSYVIKNSAGVPIGMRGVTMDINERMEIERRKDEFISIASHELKSPITSIKVFTQLLEDMFEKRKGDGSLQYLKKMNIQIKKLEQLVGDLLDVSKIQTGRISFDNRKFSLTKLIKENINLLKEVHSDYNFIYHQTENIFVKGDKERISQVIINLLSNAIKYSAQNSRIEIQAKRREKDVIVSIKDPGIGIAKEHQDKIFERFYRVFDDQDRTFPGLGMGLYISKEIILRHGGNIWLKSKHGKGSTFYFTLPLNK